ncbi:MAG TPA: thiamine pyrophosphate-dependent enzyme, partial [Solirubrobacteraceae bacterium]
LGKDSVTDDSEYVTGGMGLIGTPASHAAFAECDGFLIVGSATPYHEFWPSPGQARAVQIDINADRIGLRYPVEVGLVGDTTTVLRELIPRLERHTDRSFLETAQENTREYWRLHRVQAADHRRPMRPQTVTEALTDALPDGAIVTGDAGTVTMWSARLRLRRGMNFSFSGTLCTMGSALPYAVGAQIAHPERPVVAFMGDGALSMGMGELASLAQHRLPITVVVLRNDSLALEIWEQNALLGHPQMGNDLHPVEFAAVAEACGLRGVKLEDPAEAEKVLSEALAHDGPVLVEALVDPHEAPFGESLLSTHAQHLAQAFQAGERDRTPMARSLLEPGRMAQSPNLETVADDLRRYI